MSTLSATELVNTLSQLPFVQRIWLYGSRHSENRSIGKQLAIAIECPTASLFDWQQIRTIVADVSNATQIECIRWDTLDASAPMRQKILDERVLVHSNLKAAR